LWASYKTPSRPNVAPLQCCNSRKTAQHRLAPRSIFSGSKIMTKLTRAPSNARSPLTGRRHKASPGPVIKSAEDLRNWQRVRAMQLHAEGWTDTRICAEIGIGRTTFRDWLRHANIPDRRGRLGKEKLKEKQRQFFELRKQHPDDWITFQFSEVLGVHSKRLMKWARAIDDPLPHRTYSYRYHKHEARIRQWIAEKKPSGGWRRCYVVKVTASRSAASRSMRKGWA
jgi:transposase